MPAALCFYRAIRVYPSPLELIMVYEKSLSPPVFQVSRHYITSLRTLSIRTVACDATRQLGREFISFL